jgi:hypothetical protein
MATSRRRRPPKVDTERAETIRSCARHLKDLQRAHPQPPANVQVSQRGLPKFVAPILEQSYCTSPAALCAELAEAPAKIMAPSAEVVEPVEAAPLYGERASGAKAQTAVADMVK